jgi:hypothetical protein
MTTKFWKSVHELAQLRDKIPVERRQLSGVRITVRQDKAVLSASKVARTSQSSNGATALSAASEGEKR